MPEMTTHTWLATCPTCDAVQAAAVDDQSQRVQTFVREHLLAGYRMVRSLRVSARLAVSEWSHCGHPLTPHAGGREPVALRGFLPAMVRSDVPGWLDRPRAMPGIHLITMNRYGAACAVLPDGSLLGLKPDEFQWTDQPSTEADRAG